VPGAARDLAVVYLKGVCMGAADAVPGVSGGTIALIVGIYERLVRALTAITPRRLRRMVAGVRSGNRADARAAFEETDGAFLLALGAGVLTALVTVLRLVAVLLEGAPIATYAFFFGLIGASAVVLATDVSVDTPARGGAAVAGFLVAFVLSGRAGTVGVEPSLPAVFLGGAIAVSAMVLPGVSGSLLLVILAQYGYMSRSLSAFVDAIGRLAAGGRAGAVLEAAPPVVTFVAGAAVGLFTVAHVVRRALDRARAATLAFLVALVVGALRAPVERVDAELAAAGEGWTVAVVVTFALYALAGGVVVGLLARYTGGVLDQTHSAAPVTDDHE